tara:strand:+ start:281 stop:490 length:210 start_codon:yes stop_codon:yes gene_type:complete
MTYKLRMLGRNFYTLAVFDISGEVMFLNSGGKAWITKTGDHMGIFLEDDFDRLNKEYKKLKKPKKEMAV